MDWNPYIQSIAKAASKKWVWKVWKLSGILNVLEILSGKCLEISFSLLLKTNNMGENTIIARRFIKNYLRVNVIEPYTIQIKNELLKSVKYARQRYEVHLEEQKKSAKEKQKGEELAKVDNELETITTQCFTLEDTLKKLDTSFVDMMKKAEEKNMMHFVIEGNALKRKSEEKVKQLSVLKKWVAELQIKKRKLV